jgi:hypothetical protein
VILGDPGPGPVAPLVAPKPWRPIFLQSAPWSQDRDYWVPQLEMEGVDPEIAGQVVAEVLTLLVHPDECQVMEIPREDRVPGITEKLPLLLEDQDFWRTLVADRPWYEVVEDAWVLALLLLPLPEGGSGGAGFVGQDGQEGDGQEPDGQTATLVLEKPKVEYDQDQEILAKLLPSLRGSSSVPADKLQELVEAVRDRPGWEKFLRLIGRLSSVAWSPPARVQSTAREDVVDMETGDDLSRIVAVELARLATPELQAAACMDLLERRMLQIAVDGTEPRGSGPILVAVDVSTSMMDPIFTMDRLQRRQVAVILLMALIRIADIQKREVRFCGFTTDVVWERNVRRPREAVDAIQFLLEDLHCSGGTNFDPPLLKLGAWTKKVSGGGADLLFITDGESNVSASVVHTIRSFKKLTGARLFTLLIDGGGDSIEALSDQVVRLSSWDDLETLTEQISARR